MSRALFRCGPVPLALTATLMLGAMSAQAEPISFKDMENRDITLAKPAERVVSIVIPMASTLVALDGGPKRLVGMNPLAKSAMLEGILGKIFPQSKDIPADVTAANFVPNVEALAAAKPDLVIQWGGRGEDIVKPITNAGLNAMLIIYGTEAHTRTYMSMAANAIGRPERIDPLVQWRERVQKDIEAKAATIPAGKRPSVLYLGRALSELQASGSGANYNDWYIKLTGGVNAAAEINGAKAVSREQVAHWDPQVILLNSFEPALSTDFVYHDTILSLTRAAQAKRVYKMPLGGYRWDPPNQESPLTWMWLANLLHPDVFQYDLRAEMRTAYKLLYQYDLTDADIDGILWQSMQGQAAGYAQFAAH